MHTGKPVGIYPGAQARKIPALVAECNTSFLRDEKNRCQENSLKQNHPVPPWSIHGEVSDTHPADIVEAVYDAEGVEVAAGTECLIPAGGPVPVVVDYAGLSVVEILRKDPCED